MADYQRKIVAWMDADYRRHEGAPKPADLPSVYSTLVHVYNPKDKEDQRHFWAHSGYPFEDFESWDYLIDDLADMYGMSTA